MIDIVPKPHIIQSVQSQSLSWKDVLGELIDNAFDAGAKKVLIAATKTSITVTDDGNGCPDVAVMLTLGDRRHHGGTRLGRFGVGCKDSLIWAAHAVRINSVHEKKRQTLICNWDALQKQDSWQIADPIVTDTDELNGTEIVMEPLRSGSAWKHPGRLRDSLSLQYTPAIEGGRQIVFRVSGKEYLIPAYQFPTLQMRDEDDVDVDGKTAHVVVGLIPPGLPCDGAGLHISYGYRVICKIQNPCGRPTPNLLGWARLEGHWKLSKNKNSLISGLDRLVEAVACRFAEVIEAASREAQSVVLDGVASSINSALADLDRSGHGRRKSGGVEIFDPAGENTLKGKRKSPTNHTGTVLPTGTGGKHRQAEKTQPGRTFGPAGPGQIRVGKGLKVVFASLGVGGAAHRYSNGVVTLNRDIPAIARHADDPGIMSLHAIYAAAYYMAEKPNIGAFLQLQDVTTSVEKVSSLVGHLLTRLGPQSPETISGPAESA